MRKEKTLFIIGIWLIVLPFLGFPNFWKTLLLAITGVMVIYLGYLFRFESKSRIIKTENRSKIFVDSVNNNRTDNTN